MTQRRGYRAATVVAALMAMAGGLLSCRGNASGTAAPAAGTAAPPAGTGPTTPAAAPGTASTTGVPPTAAPTTVTTPPTTRATTTTTAVRPTTTAPGPTSGVIGSSGAEVQQVQQRLSDLGYWLGAVDGRFGSTTQQAVFAIQKAAGIPRTGVVDAATAAALTAGTRPTPISTTGHVVEVDLAHQLVLLVTNGHLDSVLNTSTGGGYVYYDHGAKQVAITPKGHFTTTWEVNGTRVSSLGVLWRPKYFIGGIALHGDSSVPPRPVSHGCVRVSNQAIDWIWATGTDPIGTPVWVY